MEQVAAIEGISVSELIRQAVAQRCEAVMGDRLEARLADVVGQFHSGGGRARMSDAEIARLVRDDNQRRRDRPHDDTG